MIGLHPNTTHKRKRSTCPKGIGHPELLNGNWQADSLAFGTFVTAVPFLPFEVVLGLFASVFDTRLVTLIATVFCKVLFTTYFFSNFDCQWAFSPIVLANYCLTEHKWSGFPDLLSVQSILANNQFRSLEIVNFVNFVLSFALRKSFANHGRPRTEGKNWVYSSNKVQ